MRNRRFLKNNPSFNPQTESRMKCETRSRTDTYYNGGNFARVPRRILGKFSQPPRAFSREFANAACPAFREARVLDRAIFVFVINHQPCLAPREWAASVYHAQICRKSKHRPVNLARESKFTTLLASLKLYSFRTNSFWSSTLQSLKVDFRSTRTRMQASLNEKLLTRR